MGKGLRLAWLPAALGLPLLTVPYSTVAAPRWWVHLGSAGPCTHSQEHKQGHPPSLVLLE